MRGFRERVRAQMNSPAAGMASSASTLPTGRLDCDNSSRDHELQTQTIMAPPPHRVPRTSTERVPSPPIHSNMKIEVEEDSKKEQLIYKKPYVRGTISETQDLKRKEAELLSIVAQLQRENKLLDSERPRSLRELLLSRVYTAGPVFPDGALEWSTNPWIPQRLSNQSLDAALTTEQFRQLAQELKKGPQYDFFYSQIQPVRCVACKQMKLIFPPAAALRSWEDFSRESRFFSCCNQEVCKACFVKHVRDSVSSSWYHNLGSLQWLECPSRNCNERLGIRCEGDLEVCLFQNGCTTAERYARKFEKLSIIRQEFESLVTPPTMSDLQLAHRLHGRLVSQGVAYDIHDPRFEPEEADETGCILDWRPGKIVYKSVANGSRVPLFLKFFKRCSERRTCAVCTRSKIEIQYQSVEYWQETCKGFEGDWMWEILVFPTSKTLQCSHDFDICSQCISGHISSLLETGGPSSCDRLTCPQCNRNFSYDEVKRIADAPTQEKYEKFLLLNVLSQDPDFRWCLSQTCHSGQIYEPNSRRKKISCNKCNFEMCFDCQVPWHNGQTCDQARNEREHGDPGYADTQTLLNTTTKPCPGCGVRIEKGAACFHMECRMCEFQFCWECLADWQQIARTGPTGHGEGCFFRTSDIRPTALRGSTLEAALEDFNQTRRPRPPTNARVIQLFDDPDGLLDDMAHGCGIP